ncbi:MAG: rhodanese-like domain-containing protein [Imperialibacter sp.]|uniref:rhodanese-like domain-containing protein n=1 Tax=Imperialibacter sp. TaxID=2038411 RepID=UPI0032EED092
MTTPGRILLLAFAIALPQFTQAQSAYDVLLSTLYSKSVPTISADSLASIQQAKKPILLDTRAKAEFDVSHLSGAKWVDYETFKPEMVKDIAKDQPIVVYCSVGYRSEKIGEKLKALGYSDVENLYGGIFEWKNEGHTVVNSKNQATDSVHCYNKLWSVWLKEGIKVYD